MQLKNIAAAVDLRMQRDHEPPGAVVVYYQVVHAAYLGVRHHDAAYLFHELFVRRLAQQRRDRVLCRAVAGHQYQYGDNKASPAVYVDVEHIAYGH